MLQYANKKQRNDRTFVLTSVKQNGFSLQYASNELQEDQTIVLSAVKQNWRVMYDISPKFKIDHQIVLEAIKQSLLVWKELILPLNLNNDRIFILKLIQQDWTFLGLVSEELKNDYEIVYEAVKQNFKAIQHASMKLQNNHNIIITAFKNGYSIQNVSQELLDDYIFMLEIVKQDGFALNFASDKLKNNYTIVMAAIEQNGFSFQYASEEQRDNSELFFKAGKHNRFAFPHVSDRLKNNKEFVLKAMKESLVRLNQIPKHLYHDHDIMLYSVHKNGFTLHYASDELKNNYNIVFEAVKQNYQVLSDIPQKEYWLNHEILLQSLKQCTQTLQHAPNEIKNDVTFAIKVLSQNEYSLSSLLEMVKYFSFTLRYGGLESYFGQLFHNKYPMKLNFFFSTILFGIMKKQQHYSTCTCKISSQIVTKDDGDGGSVKKRSFSSSPLFKKTSKLQKLNKLGIYALLDFKKQLAQFLGVRMGPEWKNIEIAYSNLKMIYTSDIPLAVLPRPLTYHC